MPLHSILDIACLSWGWLCFYLWRRASLELAKTRRLAELGRHRVGITR